MTLEILCKGHITEICGWCFGCKKDDYNRECPNYTPTLLQTFNIQENEDTERNIQYLVRAKAEKAIKNAIEAGLTGGAY